MVTDISVHWLVPLGRGTPFVTEK